MCLLAYNYFLPYPSFYRKLYLFKLGKKLWNRNIVKANLLKKIKEITSNVNLAIKVR